MVCSSYLSLIALLVFAQLAFLAVAQENIEVLGWIVPYDGPTELSANVGDTIIFRWDQGFHNVYIHPTMNCNLDNRIEVGSNSGSAYTFVDTDGSPGGTDMYFACDIGDGAHCRVGQALTVKVFSSGEAVGAEAPEEVAAVSEAPVAAPEEVAAVSEAPVAAPEEAEPEPAVVDNMTTESQTKANETESSSSSSGNSRVNSVATVIGLSVACLALVL